MTEPFHDDGTWWANPPAQGEPNVTHVESVPVPDDHMLVTKTKYEVMWLAICFLAGGWAGGLIAVIT